MDFFPQNKRRASLPRNILIDEPRDVRVLATLPDGRIVAAQEGRWLATSFHPELVADTRFHRYFLAMTAAAEYRSLNVGRDRVA